MRTDFVLDALEQALYERRPTEEDRLVHHWTVGRKEAVELATLTRVSWFNHHRLLEPIGNIPPAEAEAGTRCAVAGNQGS